MFHPTESKGFLINISVLAIGVILESFVLFKAMKEIAHETGSEAKGLAVITGSFGSFKKAKPPTKLVFMEDLVATLGGVLAIIAIVISHTTPFHQAEGLASIIIGILMMLVVVKVFMDNAAGVIGEADADMELIIGRMIKKHKLVDDVQEISVVKVGDDLHVNVKVEVKPNLEFGVLDDIQDELVKKIKTNTSITVVNMMFDETDKHNQWSVIEQALEESVDNNDK